MLLFSLNKKIKIIFYLLIFRKIFSIKFQGFIDVF
ncbi:hypothetical protein CWQ_01070 [Buchnera aphidicola str. TLW03 (Acyrthosiphon pisum)]|nr:hypothetical protein CWQ_01070 [Buchnera aphidicola str. TLW03 (Acyrthosiphon pisum)]